MYKNGYKYSQRQKSWDSSTVGKRVAAAESESFNTLHE